MQLREASPCEGGQAAREPIALVDGHAVVAAGFDRGHQPLGHGPVGVRLRGQGRLGELSGWTDESGRWAAA